MTFSNSSLFLCIWVRHRKASDECDVPQSIVFHTHRALNHHNTSSHVLQVIQRHCWLRSGSICCVVGWFLKTKRPLPAVWRVGCQVKAAVGNFNWATVKVRLTWGHRDLWPLTTEICPNESLNPIWRFSWCVAFTKPNPWSVRLR